MPFLRDILMSKRTEGRGLRREEKCVASEDLMRDDLDGAVHSFEVRHLVEVLVIISAERRLQLGPRPDVTRKVVNRRLLGDQDVDEHTVFVQSFALEGRVHHCRAARPERRIPAEPQR